MLIVLEEYRNRRAQRLRARVEPLRVAAGGAMVAPVLRARAVAHEYALAAVAFAERVVPAVAELA